jgi:D-arabinose 1-dehydrogenase-like Zn-dependent alcohol dehydrogenase
MSDAYGKAIVTYPPENGIVWKLEDAKPVEPKENEVCVKIVASGICHSDLVLSHMPPEYGLYPMVLGHEGAVKFDKFSSSR